MKAKIKGIDKVGANVQMSPDVDGGCLKIGGHFDIVCRDKHGNLKWDMTAENIFTLAGLNHVLDVVFHNATQVSTWYVGLYTDSEAESSWADAGDLTEFTSYSGDRKEFVESAASSQSLSNTASKASFSITGSGTIYGAFLVDAATGDGTTLVCAENFTEGSRSVQNGDTVEVTYTCSASDS